MAPIAFHLLSTPSEPHLISLLSTLPSSSPNYPIFLSRTHHWVHAPTLTPVALTGPTSTMQPWTHLLITHAEATSPSSHPELALPPYLTPLSLTTHFTTIVSISDSWLTSFPSLLSRLNSSIPTSLPSGWSPSDPSSLLSSSPPNDLEFSLAKTSVPFGKSKSDPANAQSLKDFIREFGGKYTGPVAMLNLLAYLPQKRGGYLRYIEAFGASIGARYGGRGMLFGEVLEEGVKKEGREEGVEKEKIGGEGEGKAEREVGEGEWEDAALVWYPSIWHFGKMLDDPEYADVDRKYKGGVLRDNAVLCCEEISWKVK